MATKLETARKTLGKQDIEDLDKMSQDDLKKRIVQANEAMREAHDELEANEAYQKAKADASALSQGKRDVNKRQNAFIAYSLHRLTEGGSDVSLSLNGGPYSGPVALGKLTDALKAQKAGN